MAPALSQPLLLFCQAILLGMAAALLYDLLRAFRLRLPRLTSALDILYCMAAGSAGRRGSCGCICCWGRWAAVCCFSPPSPRFCGRCGIFGWIPWHFCCI